MADHRFCHAWSRSKYSSVHEFRRANPNIVGTEAMPYDARFDDEVAYI
jgi:hypothetical protein